MKDAGLTSTLNTQHQNPGAPNDEMYLRQAEHLMKRGAYEPALVYLHQSLSMNPQSKVVSAVLSFVGSIHTFFHRIVVIIYMHLGT